MMLNVTSRLAVRIKHIPDDMSWTDTTCQRMRASLTISDILPGPAESKKLYDSAVQTDMELLVFEFKSLEGLRPLIPARTSPLPPSKSEIVPLKLLFRDEKYTNIMYSTATNQGCCT